MTDAPRPRVSRAACLLGYAGLLPQVAAVILVALGRIRSDPVLLRSGMGLAGNYGALILSFLGGVWWGFAVRRGEGQARLAAVAVLPSLAALGVFVLLGLWDIRSGGLPLILLGLLIILTLLVDDRLAASGEAPAGWMRLRAPLSLGLGGLTILAGLLA